MKVIVKEGGVVAQGEPGEVLTFEILEDTYGCDLLVDKNPVKGVPRITLVPGDAIVGGDMRLPQTVKVK